MNIEDRKILSLIDAFKSGKELCITEICKLLDIKRSRAYQYLDVMKKEGILLTTSMTGHRVYYSLPEREKENTFYEPIREKDIYMMNILTQLERSPQTSIQLYKNMVSSDSCLLERKGSDKPIPSSTFYNLINEMVSSDLLERNKDGLLFPYGIKYPFMLTLSPDEQDILMTHVSKNQVHGRALRSLQGKIAIITGDNNTLEFNDSVFIQYGRGCHIGTNISQYYTELVSNHFDTNVLSFYYRNKKMRFETGIAVYSQDKDMLYLMGRRIGTHKVSILKYTDISELSFTDAPNNEYGLSKYIKFLESMFSISDEKEYHVRIHFQNYPWISDRLMRLKKLRVNASVTSHGSYIEYTDYVSGLDDLASYLKSFIPYFKILSPSELTTRINTTAKRATQRYEEANK